MKLNIEQLQVKLILLGLMNMDTRVPISYAGFKNRATIYRYGKDKIVFVGQPKANMFAFYTVRDTDTNTMVEAYQKFLKIAKGDITDFKSQLVQWTNKGIPSEYADLN